MRVFPFGFLHAELTIDFAHLLGVPEDQSDKDVNGALLSKPEAQGVSTQVDGVQHWGKQDARAVRTECPDDQHFGQKTKRCRPVGLCVAISCHESHLPE
jgi:hypothetical protein